MFNSIQFNSILLSISGNLFCLHAYIEYIGTYIYYILTRHRFYTSKNVIFLSDAMSVLQGIEIHKDNELFSGFAV